jgi:antitoxin ParD1/3/4
MGTMNISLPDALREFVDEQVSRVGYATSSEYVRELIRRDQDRIRLRAMLLEGAQSAASGDADTAYFADLRKRAAPRSSAKRRA